MQVGAANGAARNFNDSIATLLNLGIGDGVATNVMLAVVTERLHVGYLLGDGPAGVLSTSNDLSQSVVPAASLSFAAGPIRREPGKPVGALGPGHFLLQGTKAMNQQKRPLAVVTGASTGIGYELAHCCARNGFDLLVVADEPEIDKAAEAFWEHGVNVEAVEADLATIEGVDKLYAALHGRKVDALLANAGRGVSKVFSIKISVKSFA